MAQQRKLLNCLKSKLDPDQTQIFNLKTTKSIELKDYDTIIIGGSIHIGSIPKKLKQFVANNMTILLKKRVALFIVCMQKDEKRDEQFNNVFPDELREVSVTNGFMGGEFNFDRMNFIEKAIIKKIAGKSTNVNEIDYEAIDAFINKLKNQ